MGEFKHWSRAEGTILHWIYSFQIWLNLLLPFLKVLCVIITQLQFVCTQNKHEKQGTWWCIIFICYTLEATFFKSLIRWLFKVKSRGEDCSWQHPVWFGGWAVVSLCVKRWMYHSSQRWAGVTSILGLPHVHMPRPCETKNPTTTNHNKLHWGLCAG